jgi:hypothetical protein
LNLWPETDLLPYHHIIRDYAADLATAVKNGFGNLFARGKSPKVPALEPLPFNEGMTA